ncbi:uncharacterized protein LOC114581318 [Dendrobium catenatum]|uniref:uncharacterized protein LOC114581318 n=1 Tax=Dendrobium catenatum TaxID=906689 RepID=UPI0010A07DB1|nr:uncharacterized protein LOC114581318 [Dendrobium catenatum]
MINTPPDLTAPANNLSIAQIISPHELPNPHNVISDPGIHFDSVVANSPLPHTSEIMQESGSSFTKEHSNSNTQHSNTFVLEAKTSSDGRPTTAVGSSTAASSDHSENSKALDHHHRWSAARSRQSCLLTKSMYFSAERNELKSTVQLLRQSMLLDDGSSRDLFESAELLSASSDTDCVSSRSNSMTPELNVPQHARVTSSGSSVSARF